MRILVLGGGGFLGREICVALATRGVDYVAPRHGELDVLTPQLEDFLTQNTYDQVINCVAYTDVDGAEKEPELAHRLNAELPTRLAKLTPHLVHFSTDFVFDGVVGEYAEDAAPNPQSVYGRTKYAGEQGVLAQGGHTVIRTSFPFGTHPKCFLQKLLAQIKVGQALSVVDALRCSPTDFAELAAWVVENELPRGICHRTNAGACTRYEFAAAVLRFLGNPVELRRAEAKPTSAPRPESSVLLTSKLPPMRAWEAALENFLAKHQALL